MNQVVSSLQTRAFMMRYASVLKQVSLIVVVGRLGGQAAPRYLEGILAQSGKQVALLRPRQHATLFASLRTFVEEIQMLIKQDKTHVIVWFDEVEADAEFIRTLPLDSLVLLPDVQGSSTLFAAQSRHLVVPYESMPSESSVQPFRLISYGRDERADARIDAMKLYRKGGELSLTIDHQTKLELATHLSGEANLYALTAAVATAYVAGSDIEAMQEGIVDIQPTSDMGFWYIIDDTGMGDVALERRDSAQSIETAIDSAKALARRRLIVVFAHEPTDVLLEKARQTADRVFLVSDTVAPQGVDVAKDAAEVVEKSSRVAKTGDLTLFIGSQFSEDFLQLHRKK